MKKAGEILKEMGFNANAPDSLKEAFIRHLIKAATGVEVAPGPNESKTRVIRSSTLETSPHQLSFGFCDELSTKDLKKEVSLKRIS